MFRDLDVGLSLLAQLRVTFCTFLGGGVLTKTSKIITTAGKGGGLVGRGSQGRREICLGC